MWLRIIWWGSLDTEGDETVDTCLFKEHLNTIYKQRMVSCNAHIRMGGLTQQRTLTFSPLSDQSFFGNGERLVTSGEGVVDSTGAGVHPCVGVLF